MSKIIDNSTGKLFPRALVNGGYVFALFSPVFMLDNPLIGGGLLLAGLLLSFSVTGLRIDTETRRFKDYSRYFWIKTGQWQSLEDYPYITLIPIRNHASGYTFSTKDSDTDEITYGIYLLNNSKTSKVLIKSLKEKDEAVSELTSLAEQIRLKVINL